MTDLLRRTPADVDASWLTAVLRAAGALGDASVVSFEAKGVGTGQMGESVRYTLTFDDPAAAADAGAPATVVGKCASADEGVRAFMGQTGYAAEIGFYTEMADTVTIPVPDCYLAILDPSGWFTLLFEDLAPAEPGDQLVPCSVENVTISTEALVGLHAPWWNNPALDSQPCLLAMPTSDAAQTGAMYSGVMGDFLARFGDGLAPEAVAVLEKLGDGFPRWDAHKPSHRTALHNDYRPDNLMWGTAAGGAPVTVVDWQGMGIGAGQEDLAFHLSLSLSIEDRRTHEAALVRRWHELMVEAGIGDYAFDECWRDYIWSTIAGLRTTIFGAIYSAVTERGEKMFAVMAERQLTAILDLGADKLLD